MIEQNRMIASIDAENPDKIQSVFMKTNSQQSQFKENILQYKISSMKKHSYQHTE